MTFAPLAEAAEFLNGVAFKPDDWGDSGMPIIRIQNLTDPTKPYNRTHRQVPDRFHVRRGDLLVSWSASLGVYEWSLQEIGLLNQHIFRVIPHEDRVDKRYLRHGLDSALMDMKRHLHGATMQHVNRGEFLGTKLFLPPLPEQRRIAAILDQADALRSKRREAIAQLDTLAQSIFLDIFGDPVANPKKWERIPLAGLVTGIDSGWSPVCLDRTAAPGEWGVLKLGAVTRCSYDPSENKALPADLLPRPELEVRTGDLLFTRKNTYELVGACAFVRETPPRLLLSDLIFRLRLNENAGMHAAFLHQLLIYPPKRREIQRLAGGSAGSMPNISKARLRSAPIERPPLPLQRRYARLLDHIEQSKAVYRASLALLDELFASLQSRAFRGEL